MRKLVIVVLGAAASVALVACGSSSSSSTTTPTASSTSSTTSTTASGGGGGTIALAADPSGALKYQQSSLSGTAGKNTIDFTNQSSLGHDVCVADSGGKEVGCSDVITGGKTTLSVDLKPGTYTYFCSVPGHEDAGMKGTLTVK
ncbi:MAG: plastocyanin/azurin family copper-binding protein [Solirubrobacterales bacterium]